MNSIIRAFGVAAVALCALSTLSCSNKTTGTGDGPAALEKPQDLANSYSDGTYILSWKKIKAASSYEVEVREADAVGDVIIQGSATISDFRVDAKKLAFKKPYTWRVRALYEDKQSEWVAKTFTTRAEPATKDYIGKWTASQEDVKVGGSAKIGGTPIFDIADVWSQAPASDKKLELVLGAHPSSESTLLLSIGNAPSYLPIKDISALPVNVGLDDDRLSCDPVLPNEPVEHIVSYIKEETPKGLSLFGSIPEEYVKMLEGLARLDINVLKEIYIESATITIKSFSVAGGFSDDTHKKLEMVMKINASLKLKLGPLPTLEDKITERILVIFAKTLELSTMDITATINATKVVE